jgi:hypothetical protein
MLVLYRDIVIPSNAALVTLSWTDRVRNFAAQFSTNQQFRVEARNTNNVVSEVLFSTLPGDPLLGNWTERTADLSSHRGETIRLAFVVNPGQFLLDVHLDNVSVRYGSPPPTSYDVYFGTNSTLGLTNRLGNTTNTSWDLPALSPFTTYYWQVVAKRSGETAGPLWQFTTLPSLAVSDVTLREGNSGITNALFNVSLVAAVSQTVTVSYATSNQTALAGSDYVATNGVLIFSPGQTNQTIAVKVIGDDLYESDETFQVHLSVPNGAVIIDGEGTGTIVNDEVLLPALSNQSVPEGSLLSFVASNHGDSEFTFSLDPGAPEGAAIDANSGLFTWTPNEAQGPADYDITVRLAHTNTATFETRTFTVTVVEVNGTPVLALVSNRIVHAGAPLTITNGATDPDVPTNLLSFSLDAGAPVGANIATNSGILTWTPADFQLGTNQFIVRVTDDGAPVMSDAVSFTVVVVLRPVIQSIVQTNSTLAVTWSAIPGNRYELEFNENVESATWSALGPAVTASSNTASQTDIFGVSTRRFYRVRLLP